MSLEQRIEPHYFDSLPEAEEAAVRLRQLGWFCDTPEEIDGTGG